MCASGCWLQGCFNKRFASERRVSRRLNVAPTSEQTDSKWNKRQKSQQTSSAGNNSDGLWPRTPHHLFIAFLRCCGDLGFKPLIWQHLITWLSLLFCCLTVATLHEQISAVAAWLLTFFVDVALHLYMRNITRAIMNHIPSCAVIPTLPCCVSVLVAVNGQPEIMIITRIQKNVFPFSFNSRNSQCCDFIFPGC